MWRDSKRCWNVEHFKSVVVCGLSHSGKSEIAAGFTCEHYFSRSSAE